MSEELVERVARAIFFMGGEEDDKHWQHVQPRHRDLARDQARAAIAAMQSTDPGIPIIRTIDATDEFVKREG